MADGARIRVTGFPELRARLAAIARSGREIGGAWQAGTTSKARQTAPARTGRGRASIHAAELTDTRAVVRGAYWLIFIDRGTKAHDIVPKGISGSGRGGKSNTRALKFEYRGKTIFAKRVHRRRMKRRPFLTAAARDSLRANLMSNEIVKLWNRRGAANTWTSRKVPT